MVTAAKKLKVPAPWKKSYDKPRRCIKEQRHYFVDKGLYNQSYGFSRVMYGCDSGTVNKGCFQTVLESPLDARRSNQSILKEINPEYSLE